MNPSRAEARAYWLRNRKNIPAQQFNQPYRPKKFTVQVRGGQNWVPFSEKVTLIGAQHCVYRFGVGAYQIILTQSGAVVERGNTSDYGT